MRAVCPDCNIGYSEKRASEKRIAQKKNKL
jgi:hypothetical protein